MKTTTETFCQSGLGKAFAARIILENIHHRQLAHSDNFTNNLLKVVTKGVVAHSPEPGQKKRCTKKKKKKIQKYKKECECIL